MAARNSSEKELKKIIQAKSMQKKLKHCFNYEQTLVKNLLWSL